MAIEYKKQIVFTKDSTIYGHQSLDEGGFPKDAGNGKLSQVLDMAESQTVDSLKDKITITIDLDDSRLYHFNIDGVSVASFEIPADRFLKSVSYDDATKTLTFTFFTGTGEESVSVDLSSLVDTYTAGNGLQLSGGVFSIKVKNTETRLKADSTGLYIDLSDITAKIKAEETARQNADTELSGRIDSLSDTVSGIETRVDAKVAKAETAATNASNSATSAQASATTASEKATSATNSASRASNSEVKAKASETNAKDSEDNAKASEDNASASEANAKLSETNAKASETKAKTSETNAKASETSALASAIKAGTSEANAEESATKALASETNAKASETNAKASEASTKAYKEQAQALLEQADLNLIESIEQTTASTESSGKNVITITQKDGTKSTFDVYNGAKGDTATVQQASPTVAGIMKLFTSLGQDTDGAPTNKAVQDAISAISLKMHPVGSYYISDKEDNPGSLFGGTWESVKDVMLIGAGNKYVAGSTGGNAAHTLSKDEMPSHNHGESGGHTHSRGTMNITGYVYGDYVRRDLNVTAGGAFYKDDSLKGSLGDSKYNNCATGLRFDASKSWTGSTSSNGNHTHSTEGSSKAFSILNPYRAVYIWRRTA